MIFISHSKLIQNLNFDFQMVSSRYNTIMLFLKITTTSKETVYKIVIYEQIYQTKI